MWREEICGGFIGVVTWCKLTKSMNSVKKGGIPVQSEDKKRQSQADAGSSNTDSAGSHCVRSVRHASKLLRDFLRPRCSQCKANGYLHKQVRQYCPSPRVIMQFSRCSPGSLVFGITTCFWKSESPLRENHLCCAWRQLKHLLNVDTRWR